MDVCAASQAGGRETFRLLAAVALTVSALLLAAAERPETAAQATALAWLNLLDSADYDNSWEAAAPIFRPAITATANMW
jgi:hypothetical protein